MSADRRVPPRHAPPYKPMLVGVAIAIALIAVLSTWAWRVPRGTTLAHWYQADTPTYLCYARMAARSPTLVSYAWPHDLRPSPPPILVNLPINAMGALLRLGVPPTAMEHVTRLLFGALMYLALGALLRRIFHPGRWFWSAFAIVALGSGFAWLVSAVDAIDAHNFASAFRREVIRVEAPYDWWALDTFRLLFYPLELAYHAMIFGQLWALGSRRYGISIVFCALACLSNPFVGIQASGVQIASLVLAHTNRPRPRIAIVIASLAVVALFGVYYGFLLPLDSEVRALQEQHQSSLDTPLGLGTLLVVHGPALLSLLALVFDGAFRHHAWKRFHLVPIVVLVLWTLFLTQNSRFGFDSKLMPMHFTRGYMHAGLWILSLAWLQFRLARFGRPSRGAAIGVAIAILLLPDTFLFVEHIHLVGPHNPSIVWPADFEQVHRYLRRQRAPRRVVTWSHTLGPQICALHDHMSGAGTPRTTPHWVERRAEIDRLSRDPTREPPLIRWADIVIAGTPDEPWVNAMRAMPQFREELCNPTWCVFRRLSDSP